MIVQKFKKKAFSLSELVIGLAIIGVLFTVMVQRTENSVYKAREAVVKNDFKSYGDVIESQLYDTANVIFANNEPSKLINYINNSLTSDLRLKESENNYIELMGSRTRTLSDNNTIIKYYLSSKQDPWGTPYKIECTLYKDKNEADIKLVSLCKDTYSSEDDLIMDIKFLDGHTYRTTEGFTGPNIDSYNQEDVPIIPIEPAVPEEPEIEVVAGEYPRLSGGISSLSMLKGDKTAINTLFGLQPWDNLRQVVTGNTALSNATNVNSTEFVIGVDEDGNVYSKNYNGLDVTTGVKQVAVPNSSAANVLTLREDGTVDCTNDCGIEALSGVRKIANGNNIHVILTDSGNVIVRECQTHSGIKYTSWDIGVNYQTGDTVEWQGKLYTCRLSHTSYGRDWSPNLTPALWIDLNLDADNSNELDNTPYWATNTVYKVADKVRVDNVIYTCVQAHTSQIGWQPYDGSALWLAIHKLSSSKSTFKDVGLTSSWRNITDIAVLSYNERHDKTSDTDESTSDLEVVVAIDSNGTVYSTDSKVKEDTGIVRIVAGDCVVAGLKEDGTVSILYSKCRNRDVSDWEHMVEIGVSSCALHGVQKDGTIVSTKFSSSINDWNVNME